ncbi:hypothetical protein [Vibrio diabolicus]|uniref:hypothetical protein n=1 Tax=Vibrio diabolicus TaxID=50719 RepID=UPI0037500858
MKKKLILFPGLIPAKEISSNCLDSDIVGVIVKSKKISNFNCFSKDVLRSKESFLEDNRHVKVSNNNPFEKYADCYGYVINDSRTIFIAERQLRLYGINGAFQLSNKIETLVYNILDYLLLKKPDRLVFQATPHGIYTWVFAKVAEFLNIEVAFNAMTLLPWKYQPVIGLDAQIPLDVKRYQAFSNSDKTRVDSYVSKKMKDYSEAIPDYEKQRELKYKGKFFSFRNELNYLFKLGYKHLPFKVIECFRKKMSFDEYNKLANIDYPKNNNIVFFLHFQPERTSLPEGGLFCNQLLIIRQLNELARRYSLNVLVKEHPSMFRQPWDSSARSRYFYRQIHKMSHVHIVPLEVNSYELINTAVLNVTITGTVILESLLKGKPVLAYGLKQLPNIDGLIRYHDSDSSQKIERYILDCDSVSDISFEKLELLLYEVDKSSFFVDIEYNTSIESFRFLCSDFSYDSEV